MASGVVKVMMPILECCLPRNNRVMLPKCYSAYKLSMGFTLIEILVVMVIIGLMAGVAMPRLFNISQRYEMAAQREALLTAIGTLGYRAYVSGQPIELTTLEAPAAASAPISIPQGWRVETDAPIHYSFNGLCSGGKITLIAPNKTSEEMQMNPPICKPVSN